VRLGGRRRDNARVYEDDLAELWLRRFGIAAAVAAAFIAALIGTASTSSGSIDGWVRIAAFGTAVACVVTACGLVRRSKGISWGAVVAAAVFVAVGYLAAS
jgi:hypothetical protein